MATGVLETRGSAIGDTERLPWLDLSRDIPLGTRPRKGPAPAARRLIPLALVVAALFVAGVGYISYQLGQDDGAAKIVAQEPASTTVALPRSAPAVPAMPVAAAPEAPVVPSQTVAEAPRRPVAKRPRQRILTFDIPPGRYSSESDAAAPAEPQTPPLLNAAPVIATAPPPPVVVRPRPRAPGPIAPRGQVLNVGSFKTSTNADLAWAKMVQRYPYLASLKRQVTPFYYTRANRTYWRLDLAAPRRSDSKKLCGYIKQIGYGCTVA